MKKWKIDVHSITFRLGLYLSLFALVLIILVWFLQTWSMDNRYKDMKSAQTTRIAREIRSAYLSSGRDVWTLQSMIKDTASTNDLIIYVRDDNNTPIVLEDGSFVDNSFRAGGRFQETEDRIRRLHMLILSSEFDSATYIETDKGSNLQTLEYVSLLPTPTQSDTSYYMYIFAPLYPVQSTVAILRSQLKYIAILLLILAAILAFILSSRIARPIRDITRSAAEMSRGNYSVKFRGGNYTEMKDLANTLNMAENEMNKAGQYQQDLIANVSHDLRTPLTMIRSYAEMIRDISGDKPEKRNAHLQVIIDESDRLTTLVNDMLNLSRMQSHRMVILPAPFDLRQAADTILASYRVMEEKEGYHIIENLGKTPLPVIADEDKIKQVMSNLLSNAVKYCGEDKEILVTLKRTGRSVRFSVTDHGMGIAPEELPHVWDKYYKTSTHHVRQTEGTGLGLSIVREILTLHQAEYDVKSTVGKGSTFWFELPLQKVSRRGAAELLQAAPVQEAWAADVQASVQAEAAPAQEAAQEAKTE